MTPEGASVNLGARFTHKCGVSMRFSSYGVNLGESLPPMGTTFLRGDRSGFVRYKTCAVLSAKHSHRFTRQQKSGVVMRIPRVNVSERFTRQETPR
jgi:hypothetical protein